MQGHDTERIKVDETTYRVQCVWCGDYFEAQRYDASACSARCRVAMSREPKARVRWAEHTRTQGRAIGRYVQERGRRYDPAVYEAVLDLRNSLNATLALFEEV